MNATSGKKKKFLIVLIYFSILAPIKVKDYHAQRECESKL